MFCFITLLWIKLALFRERGITVKLCFYYQYYLFFIANKIKELKNFN